MIFSINFDLFIAQQGLVTYRETNLLYDRNVSSTANKQRIAAVIAHGKLILIIYFPHKSFINIFLRICTYVVRKSCYHEVVVRPVA